MRIVNLTALLALPLATAALAGCGYKPLYAQARGDNTQIEVGDVEMGTTAQKLGERRPAQVMRQNLQRYYTGGADSPYHLDLKLSESSSTLAVTKDATVQRYNLTLRANGSVYGPQGKQLYTFTTDASSAYNAQSSPFSTDADKQSAEDAAVDLLTQEILQDMAVFLNAQRTNAAQGRK